MRDLQLSSQLGVAEILALPVVRAEPEREDSPGVPVVLGADRAGLSASDRAEIDAFLDDVDHFEGAGAVSVLPRPTRTPRKLLLFGIGEGDQGCWRSAGAALAAAARRDTTLTVAVPDADVTNTSLAEAEAVEGLCEGLWLASYRYRVGSDSPDTSDSGPALTEVTVACSSDEGCARARTTAQLVAEATLFARDLTNTPSNIKNPEWFAGQVLNQINDTRHLGCEVYTSPWLFEQGFGGLLAVSRGSVNQPRLLVLGWNPPQASGHVVLVGKGITFDTGGIVIKPRDSMKLMRKDMGGAAAVVAATVGAARLALPVRVTAVVPLAENALGGDSFRPGDVIRQFGGTTTEVLDTDAEGRLVLADALAYSARWLDPDVLIDLGTLTGAQSVALGKRTAALFTEDTHLAEALNHAAERSGERLWRMPLVDEYLEALHSDIADIANVATSGGAGAITAALYLREFTGTARSHWAHLDMSAPAWSDSASSELARGATGWGTRTLLRYLADFAADRESPSH